MFLLLFYKTAGEQASEQASEQVQILVYAIRKNVYSMCDIQRRLNISSRRYVLVEMLTPAIEQGYVLRAYPDKPRQFQIILPLKELLSTFKGKCF